MKTTLQRLTIAGVKAQLKPLGVTMNSKPETGEYRVNLAGGTEATAYYATELDDALATGLYMAQPLTLKVGAL